MFSSDVLRHSITIFWNKVGIKGIRGNKLTEATTKVYKDVRMIAKFHDRV